MPESKNLYIKNDVYDAEIIFVVIYLLYYEIINRATSASITDLYLTVSLQLCAATVQKVWGRPEKTLPQMSITHVCPDLKQMKYLRWHIFTSVQWPLETAVWPGRCLQPLWEGEEERHASRTHARSTRGRDLSRFCISANGSFHLLFLGLFLSCRGWISSGSFAGIISFVLFLNG